MFLLHFIALEKLTCKVVMVGTSRGRALIDIMATAKNHSGYISELLVAHVLSDCETVTCLFVIKKSLVVKVLMGRTS